MRKPRLFTALRSADATAPPVAGSVRTLKGRDAVEAITDPSTVVIDVRTPSEVAGGAIRGARHMDVLAPGFRACVDALDRDGRYVLYCRSGNRSGQAARTMAGMGFTDVVNAGGFGALSRAGAPTTRR